jgi:hypothetical protein
MPPWPDPGGPGRSAQDEPVGGGRGQGGADADLEGGHQADLERGRADRGQAVVTERAAREGRRHGGQAGR